MPACYICGVDTPYQVRDEQDGHRHHACPVCTDETNRVRQHLIDQNPRLAFGRALLWVPQPLQCFACGTENNVTIVNNRALCLECGGVVLSTYNCTECGTLQGTPGRCPACERQLSVALRRARCGQCGARVEGGQSTCEWCARRLSRQLANPFSAVVPIFTDTPRQRQQPRHNCDGCGARTEIAGYCQTCQDARRAERATRAGRARPQPAWDTSVGARLKAERKPKKEPPKPKEPENLWAKKLLAEEDDF